MIVSCPACNGRFNVDPARLAPDGRKVRCARCAHVWRVGADGVPAPETQTPAAGTQAPGVPEHPAGDRPEHVAGSEPSPGEAADAEAESPGDETAAAAQEGGLVVSARELLEREGTAAQPAPPPEAAGGAEEAAAGEEAVPKAEGEPGKPVLLAEGPKKESQNTAQDTKEAALANLAARREKQRGKRQKGGRKFQIFLLVLCLIVIALLAVAHFTGSFTPGGIREARDIPAVGDTPAPANVDEVESKPAGDADTTGEKQ